MKCRKCGTELFEGALFCGMCGEKVPQEEKASSFSAGAVYINMGHPLGYAYINKEIVYLIDNGIQQVKVSQEVFRTWAELPQKAGNKDALTLLMEKDCALNLSSEVHKNRFLACTPCRQGFGAVHEGKQAIMLGQTPVYITEDQLIAWRLSNGKNSVKRICGLNGWSEKHIIDVLFNLITYDLIYFVNVS